MLVRALITLGCFCPSLALADASQFDARAAAQAVVAATADADADVTSPDLALPVEAPPPSPHKPWIKAARATNVAANGLTAGWLLGSKLFTSPVRENLDAAGWIEMQSAFNATTQPWTGVMMSSAVLTGVPQLILDHDFKKPAVILGAAGTALNIAVIVTTLVWNVPVNDVTATADPQNPPANWRSLRRQWEDAHTARSIFSTAGLVLNVLSFSFE